MQAKRNFLYVLMVITSIFTISVSNASISQSNPVSMLQSIADNMISGLKAHKATLKTKPQIVYDLAYRYVVPYADLTTMSKQVLPANIWRQATPAQQAQFKREFTKTLIRTYASALTSYDNQTVQFFPIRGDYSNARTVTVNSEINNPSGSPIRVSYRLLHSGGNWRLFDMSVEGVSLIDSFRAQFSDILASGNMQTLLNQMESHNQAKR